MSRKPLWEGGYKILCNILINEEQLCQKFQESSFISKVSQLLPVGQLWSPICF